MNNTNDGSYDFCNDPDAVVAEASLVELLRPCSQLAITVPLFIAIQMALFIVGGLWRECWMSRSGIEEDDIRMILSSRRNAVVREGGDERMEPGGDDKDESVTPIASDKESQENAEKSDGELIMATDTDSDPSQSNIQPPPIEPPGESHSQPTEVMHHVLETEEDKASIIPPPPIDDATGIRRFDLQYLVLKYGDKKLRVLDSVPRKTLHFLSAFCLAFQLQVISNTFVTNGQAGFFGAAANTVILSICYFFFPDSWITMRLFGAFARTRDGKYGRVNILFAYTTTSIGIFVNYILAVVGIIPHLQDSNLQMLMGVLYYAPLAVGDALGELIGGPFGGTFFPTFQVKGLGEINRKSVEGCIAVFAGSFVACCLVCVPFGATSPSWILLCFCMAVASTIVETVAFRSTDNFCIPFVNVLILMLAFGVFGEHFDSNM